VAVAVGVPFDGVVGGGVGGGGGCSKGGQGVVRLS
jgi:hypothetical protein